jgi:hypothetical protein
VAFIRLITCAGAELGSKIWGGQIEKKKFGGAKTIKIIKFRGKINKFFFFFGETPGLGGPGPPKARGSSAPARAGVRKGKS